MSNPLERKLRLFGDLPMEDRVLLDRIVMQTRKLGAHKTIIQEGEAPADVHLVLDGLACRCKYLRDGEKQIFAYLVPGDFCDMHVFILNAMDHAIETVSPCTLVDIPRSDVLEMASRPAIARAMWWATLVDEATLREWLVNLGQRDAVDRIAHLFCEMHLRMKSVGLADRGEFALPITQNELGNTMGLTPVHVNRSLQELRRRGLIEFKFGKIRIPDLEKLRDLCGFNANYLHLGGGGKQDRPASVSV